MACIFTSLYNIKGSTVITIFLYTVHGFARAFYEVIEEDKLETIFGLNVKGDTSLPLMISGVITLEAGTASE